MVGRKPRWTNEDALCAIGGELVDSRIDGVGCEEIASTVKGQAETLARYRAERALYTVGSNFVDRGRLDSDRCHRWP